jgi:hypothetical protein
MNAFESDVCFWRWPEVIGYERLFGYLNDDLTHPAHGKSALISF